MALRKDDQISGDTWHRLLREVSLLEKALKHTTEKVHKETGLTSLQRHILRRLISEGEATISDIARERKVSRQSSQMLVNEMLKRDMVIRQENPRHKSSYLISITEKGRIQFEKARKQEDSILEKKLCKVKSEGIDDAADLLHRVRDILEKEI